MKKFLLLLTSALLVASIAHAQTTPIQSYGVAISNDGTTGTVAYKPVVYTSAGNAVVAPAGTTSLIIGIDDGTNPGTSGKDFVVNVPGSFAKCVFDGATTINDLVVASPTTTGCHDSGTTVVSSSQCLGQVLSTNGGAGTYLIRYGCTASPLTPTLVLIPGCRTSTPVAVTGVTAETAVLTCLIPANTLGTQGQIYWWGSASTSSGNTGTCSFIVRLTTSSLGISSGGTVSTTGVTANRFGAFYGGIGNQNSLTTQNAWGNWTFVATVVGGTSATIGQNMGVAQYISFNLQPSSATTTTCNLLAVGAYYTQ